MDGNYWTYSRRPATSEGAKFGEHIREFYHRPSILSRKNWPSARVQLRRIVATFGSFTGKEPPVGRIRAHSSLLETELQLITCLRYLKKMCFNKIPIKFDKT